MKKAGLYIAGVVIIVVAFAIQQYFSYIGPQLAARQQIENQLLQLKVQQEQLDSQHFMIERQLRREQLTQTLTYSIIVMFLITGALVSVYIYIKFDKRREAWARPIDGTYALQDIVQNGVKWRIDPNKSPSGAFGIAPSGALLQAPVEESFGPDRQLAYNMKVQGTRTATAVVGEEGQGIRYAATGKFLAGAYDKVHKLPKFNDEPQQELIEEKKEIKLLTINDAIQGSNKTKWIIGQDKESGDLSEFNIREIIHFGIVGTTNTGKTSSTGLMTTYYARKSGYHVIVLDGKGLLDWTPYGDVFEVHTTSAGNIGQYVLEIAKIYKQRKEYMNQQKIESFYDSKHGIKPILIVFEEFGAICDDLRLSKNEKTLKRVELAIGKMMRDSRAVGMHFAFIDQDISRWNATMISLVKYWISYKMEGGTGNILKMYYTDQLNQTGQFTSSSNKKAKYDAWHTKSEIDVKTLSNIGEYLLPVIESEDEDIDELIENADEEAVETKVEKPITHKIESKPINQPKAVELNEKMSKLYDALTEEDIECIIITHRTTNSFRQTTQAVWGEGKFGKFYNIIVEKVLQDNGIKY